MNPEQRNAALAKAKNIRAVVLDNDGVLTDNTEIIGFPEGTVLKRRSHYDGQGISFLRAAGIRVAVLTGDAGKGAVAIQNLVNKWNSLPSCESGAWKDIHLTTGIMAQKKADKLRDLLNEWKITPGECAVMGDDFVDLPMLKLAGFKAAPCTAEKPIRRMVDFVSDRPGGKGAVRDLANFILEAKGIDLSTLAVA